MNNLKMHYFCFIWKNSVILDNAIGIKTFNLQQISFWQFVLVEESSKIRMAPKCMFADYVIFNLLTSRKHEKQDYMFSFPQPLSGRQTPKKVGKVPEEELSFVSLWIWDKATGTALCQKGVGCHHGCTQCGFKRTGKCFCLFLVVLILLLLLKKFL